MKKLVIVPLLLLSLLACTQNRTTEEKQLIEKIRTTTLTAQDFYQRGKEEFSKNFYLNNTNDRIALERADYFYHQALEYDPTFAQAYAGLALVYIFKGQGYRDSALILADKALSYDDQLADAYVARGHYYWNDNDRAIEEYNKAIEVNPNNWRTYSAKGFKYMWTLDDLVQSIDNLHKAASLNRGSELPSLLRNISASLDYAGFHEKAIDFSQDAFKLDGDSADHYQRLGIFEYEQNGNLEKAIEYFKKGYAIDTTNFGILHAISPKYMLLGQYEEALKFYKRQEKSSMGLPPQRKLELGYVYWQLGNKDQAEDYFNEVITDYNQRIESGGPMGGRSHFDLAMVYAFKGENEKVYENLRTYIQMQKIRSYIVIDIKDNPLFNSIRNETAFQQIVKDVEAKYQAEHERVRQWLEENEML